MLLTVLLKMNVTSLVRYILKNFESQFFRDLVECFSN